MTAPAPVDRRASYDCPRGHHHVGRIVPCLCGLAGEACDRVHIQDWTPPLHADGTEYGAEERGWLIELPGPAPQWWAGYGRNSWTVSSVNPIRFARRADADNVRRFVLERDDAIVTEHLWS